MITRNTSPLISLAFLLVSYSLASCGAPAADNDTAQDGGTCDLRPELWGRDCGFSAHCGDVMHCIRQCMSCDVHCKVECDTTADCQAVGAGACTNYEIEGFKFGYCTEAPTQCPATPTPANNGVAGSSGPATSGVAATSGGPVTSGGVSAGASGTSATSGAANVSAASGVSTTTPIATNVSGGAATATTGVGSATTSAASDASAETSGAGGAASIGSEGSGFSSNPCAGFVGNVCGSTSGAQTDHLYLCADDDVYGSVLCANGCMEQPSGEQDYCKGDDPCVSNVFAADQAASYCGSNLSPAADPNVLYTCRGPRTESELACSNGCLPAPPGEADTCAEG